MTRNTDSAAKSGMSALKAPKHMTTSPKSPSGAGRKPQTSSAKTPGNSTPREIAARRETGGND